MSNTAYQFDWNIPIKPYLGAGLGVSRVSFRVSSHQTGENYLKDDAVTGAYQVFAGARVPIGKRFSVAAEYRYWSTFKFNMTSEADERVKGKYTGHMAMLNFTYQLSDGDNGQTTPATAPEPDRSGWYLGFQLGAAAAGDARIDDDLIDTNFDAFDLGGATSLAAGYSHVRPSGHRLRVELELGYWQNGAELIEFGEFLGELRLDGDVKVQNIAANFFYDFGREGALKPYVGFGVGYANLDYDVEIRNDGDTSDFLKDDFSGLSAQILFGVGARLTSKVEASLNYRYWWAPTVKLETPTDSKVETEHVVHMLTLGIRYRLGR
jgi:opacity protein-like surface antigen